MEREKRQRYSNEFRRNAVERMNAWDNIIALAQGGSASVADCSTFGVIDPPRPGGSSLDWISTVQKPYVIELSGLTSSEKQIPRNCWKH